MTLTMTMMMTTATTAFNFYLAGQLLQLTPVTAGQLVLLKNF